MNEKVVQLKLLLSQSALNTNKPMLIMTWCSIILVKIFKKAQM